MFFLYKNNVYTNGIVFQNYVWLYKQLNAFIKTGRYGWNDVETNKLY